MSDEVDAKLKLLTDDIHIIKTLLGQVIAAIRDAESEVPEKMRRFANYMHDVHDIKYMYEEHGQAVPAYTLREIERLDDRYRQLLDEMNAEGGTFNKIRREMAKDPENRWDHTRQLKGPANETRTSPIQPDGIDQDRTAIDSSKSPSSRETGDS